MCTEPHHHPGAVAASAIRPDQGTAEHPGRTLSVIDTAAMTVRGGVPTGSGPHGVVIDTSGTWAWVEDDEVVRRRRRDAAPRRGGRSCTHAVPLSRHNPRPSTSVLRMGTVKLIGGLGDSGLSFACFA